MLLFQRPWTRQSPPDTRMAPKWLARGLRSSFVADGGIGRDAALGAGNAETATTGLTNTFTRQGQTLTYAGGANFAGLKTTTFPATQFITIVVAASRIELTAANRRIFGHAGWALLPSAVGFGIYVGGVEVWSFVLAGCTTALVVSHELTTGSLTPVAYCDGVKLTPTSVSGYSSLTISGTVMFGNQDGIDRQISADIQAAHIFTTNLSDAECKSISQNPLQLFAQQPRGLMWAPSATVQLLRPTSDISAGAWTPSTGINLYAMLDEVTADDADFITTSSASTCEVKLSTGVDPVSSAGHLPRIRAKGSGTLTVHLVQGTTIIKTMAPTLTGSYQTFAFTLSGAEADAITDYGDLRYRYVSS